MRKSVKRTSLFTAILTFIIALFLSVTTYVYPAQMQGGETFTMDAGASVKLSSNGLRFTATMDKAYYDMIVENDKVELWGYIAPVEEFDKVVEYKDLGIKVGSALDESKIYEGEDGMYHANVVLTDLHKYTSGGQYLYEKSFSAILFIKDNRTGTPVYTYADLAKDSDNDVNIESQSRTQYYVVNKAMLDGNKSYEKALMSTYGAWYGASEGLPIMITSMEEYNAFNEKANAVDFTGKHVYVSKTIKDSCGIAGNATLGNATLKSEDHVVTYYDGNRVIDQVFVADGANASTAEPTREGYDFVEWLGDQTNVTEDRAIYAKWKASKGNPKDVGEMIVYGATLANGNEIKSEASLFGQKVILASGDLGDGAYYPGSTNDKPDPTDENNTADQAYIAYKGAYGFNDYFVADFTGMNMPTLAFFAKNYNNSIFYGDGTKNGVVVSTGLTWPDGRLFTEPEAFCTSVFNGAGLCMWGPHMIYATAKNADPTSNGVLLHANEANVALGRANLVNGTQYRIIMGFQPGDDASNKAIKLVYSLYDITNNVLVESRAINTYNFFADGWANANQTRDQFCSGSIVAYGHFGTTTVLDKVYDIYEDTTVNAIAAELGMNSYHNATQTGDAITLAAGSIGAGADYTKGQNAGGSITQSYYAINGEYNFNDYVAFDFTGKNMPEVMFFAKNYNDSMYYSEGKQGMAVASGITLWNGNIGSAQSNNTAVGVSGPFGAYFEGAEAPHGGNMMSDFASKLARANLEDGTQYRVIMGFVNNGTTFSLKYHLYKVATGELVEAVSQDSWAFFTGKNAAVNNMTLENLNGSIVLYGKFATTCTIDKVHGVFEDTDIETIAAGMNLNTRTVKFVNYDGTELQTLQIPVGVVPEYSGETPTKSGSHALFGKYAFAGWDKEITAVTEDVTYTAVFAGGDVRSDLTLSTSKPVLPSDNGDGVVLTKSNLGDGANYVSGQNNGGFVDQSFLAFDGNYALNDYIAFDFTGKNMPEVAFFAKNYNNSMYAEGTSKQGIVVVTGITTYNGQLDSGVNSNGTQINYGFPYMIQDASNGGFVKGAFANSALGRANLVDNTHYRVIMGFTGSGSAITLNWYLYNIDTATVVEQSSMTTWNFFTGSNGQVGNMTINDLSGSIVLYGKFGVDVTLDKIHGVFEDTNIATLANGLNSGAEYTVKFVGPNGTVLQESTMGFGEMPIYEGNEPTAYDTFLFGDYKFIGWDKPLVAVSGDVTYTAMFEGSERGNVTKNNVTYSGTSIVLGASEIGGGANYALGQQNDDGDATPSFVRQSYMAFDGNYALNDYVAFDFTGKNLPEIAFFAKNYNDSMYAEGTSKQGIVVVTGITTYNGQLSSGVNSNGTQINYGFPYMIQNAADGGFAKGAFANSALGRANLVDNTHYRVIMGFTGSGSAITLNWYLYNLDTQAVVEQSSMTTWNFFTGSNGQVGNMTINDLSGSIVLYGKFGTTCTVDAFHGVFEDTDLATVASGLNGTSSYTVTFQDAEGNVLQENEMPFGTIPAYKGEEPTAYDTFLFGDYKFIGWDKPLSAVSGDVTYTAMFEGSERGNVTKNNTTYSGESVILGAGSIGDGASYTIGQNNGGYVRQSYMAFDGNYALNDYVAFDFTGKNMPEVAFFAKNYNDSMYAEGTSKQGIVVVTGITTWDGQLGSGVNSNGAQINYGFPYMIQNTADGGFVNGSFANSALGRANLVDNTHYRVIMGFTGSGSAITLNWYLYNLDTQEVVEQSSMTTWNFFTGSNAKVGNMTINDLSGSIVLYGKFGVATTIDKVHGVFEDTDLATVANGLNGTSSYTVTFQDAEGNVLQENEMPFGTIPAFNGEIPEKEDDAMYIDYVASWDKPISIVTGNVVYTLQYVGTKRSENVTENGEGIILGAGSIGAGANYTIGQNAGGSITQAYYSLGSGYSLNDFIALDFTGKNMPEVMFFAKNYDTSMYYSEGKQGMVVASGITLWDGSIGSAQTNNTKMGVSGPFGAYFEAAAAPRGGNMMSDFEAELARANLVDGTHYRVVMGFTSESEYSVTLNWYLHNMDTNEAVNGTSQATWNFFTGSDDKVGNMTVSDLVGSIVLYGKFGTTCTVDKIFDVFEDTTFKDVVDTVCVAGDVSESVVDPLGYLKKYDDKFDFYAYSCYSDGTYEIDGQKYYIGKNLATLKQYALYGGAGMTIYYPQNDMIISEDAQTVVNAKKLVDDLAKVGIHKTIFQDIRILNLSMRETAIVGDGCQFKTEAELDAYVYNCVKDYANYPGVYGIQLGDEPKYACLSAYAAVYNSIKRVNAQYGFNLFIQFNLNPLNVTQNVYDNYYPATSGTYEWNSYRYTLGIRDRFTDCMTRYQQYIRDFLDAMGPDSIMYDDYPIREDKSGNNVILDSYIPCLQFVAKEASDRGIKFYHITQSHENNADGTVHKREVTEAGANWLNNILLGFGVKQIAYYTYYTRAQSDSTGGESYVDGSSFVDYNGNPTELYDVMKDILTDNQIFASTILQFDYKGSRTYGSADHFAEVTVQDTFTKLTACSVNTGAALVTELYDDENDNYMYMAMNALDPSLTTEETVTMAFSGYTHVLVYTNGTFEVVELSKGSYVATLTPGEAVFVIPYNA